MYIYTLGFFLSLFIFESTYTNTPIYMELIIVNL